MNEINDIIKIEGIFHNKTKNYSQSILDTRIQKYMTEFPENLDKIITYFENDLTLYLENTDDNTKLFAKKQNKIRMKANSEIYSPEQMIDLLFLDIDNVYINNKQNDQPPIQENHQPNTDVEKKLLSFQIPHLYQMYESFQENNCIIDASDTGTGKTYVGLALSSMLNLKPFIICPKSVISNWVSVAKDLGVEMFGVSNYESLKNGKYYTPDFEKVKCPYMDIIDNEDDEKKDDEKKKKISKLDFAFYFPKDIIIIFDEAHRCKNYKSITSKLLLSISKNNNNKILLLSATITDKINCFKPFGVTFGFYNDVKNFRKWMRKKLLMNKNKYQYLENDDYRMLNIIHDNIFPEKGSKMKISELGDLFPKNQVTARLYFCQNYDEIQKQYEMIKKVFEDYKQKEEKTFFPLAKIMYARMRIEQYKIPIIIDLATEALDNGYSVVIFTCFSETMYGLADHLKTDCLIHGQQSREERQSSIDDFQSNKSNIIISMIQAGNVGISLHDIHGGHPRMSLINPSWNGIEMKQALGRIHRAAAKSPALQRIIYCYKTYEEEICKLIEKKINIIDTINEGGLVVDKIDMEVMKEIENQDKIEEKNPDNLQEEKPGKIKEKIKKKFEKVLDTYGTNEKKKEKEKILGEKKSFSEYYKDGDDDDDNVKSINDKKIKKKKK